MTIMIIGNGSCLDYLRIEVGLVEKQPDDSIRFTDTLNEMPVLIYCENFGGDVFLVLKEISV
jgi:hypothetical protein